ncbi:hypothetical protein BDP27DRAFT_1338304, partial [Rhodocollybia butyracea]
MNSHPNTSRRYSIPATTTSPYTPSLSPQASSWPSHSPNMPFHIGYPSQSPLSPSAVQIRGENPSLHREGIPGQLGYWSVRTLSESGHGTATGSLSHIIRHETPELRNPVSRPSRTIPLPSQIPFNGREVSLHPALRYEASAGARRLALVEINVATTLPATILEMARNSRALNEPATNPLVPSINVVAADNRLPPITVHHGPVGYVTIADVLYAICMSLHEEHRRPVRGERERSGENVRSRPTHRTQRFHILEGRTRFVGLSRGAPEVHLGAEVWRMFL